MKRCLEWMKIIVAATFLLTVMAAQPFSSAGPRDFWLRSVPAVVFAVSPNAEPKAVPADGDIYLELMASRVSTINGEFTGHAFMCIELLLSSGIKEDCYGFYPKNDNVKGYIGGPGVVQSEFRKKPDRFSRVDQSIRTKITPAQRSNILGLVNDWNKADYSLARQQCVDFISSAAAAAGLKIPPRQATDFPLDFLKKLKAINP